MKASDMLNAHDGKLFVQDALLTIGVCAARLNDPASSEEYGNRIASLAVGYSVFVGTSENIQKRINLIVNALTQGDKAEFIDLAVRSLPTKLKETAFAWPVDILVDDGVRVEEKEEFLHELATKLSLDEHVATEIIHVRAIRNMTVRTYGYEVGNETNVVNWK
jgi:hypothetical protein